MTEIQLAAAEALLGVNSKPGCNVGRSTARFLNDIIKHPNRDLSPRQAAWLWRTVDVHRYVLDLQRINTQGERRSVLLAVLSESDHIERQRKDAFRKLCGIHWPERSDPILARCLCALSLGDESALAPMQDRAEELGDPRLAEIQEYPKKLGEEKRLGHWGKPLMPLMRLRAVFRECLNPLCVIRVDGTSVGWCRDPNPFYRAIEKLDILLAWFEVVGEDSQNSVEDLAVCSEPQPGQWSRFRQAREWLESERRPMHATQGRE